MKGKKPGTILRNVLLCSIVVLTMGFLGFAVRAFSTPDTTGLIFGGLVVVSIVILVFYCVLHRSARQLTADSLLRESPLARRSIFSHLLAWKRGGVRWVLSSVPVLRRAWHGIGHSFLPRKAQAKLGERMSAEAGVASVPKLPPSRRAA